MAEQQEPSPEDRIRALEGFRYEMLGRVNTIETIALQACLSILEKHARDPVATAQAMRARWLKAAEVPPSGRFPGVDPVHLDAVSQEYRDAIEQLTHHLLLAAAGLATTRGRKGNRSPTRRSSRRASSRRRP
jgi:hypothetical protein